MHRSVKHRVRILAVRIARVAAGVGLGTACLAIPPAQGAGNVSLGLQTGLYRPQSEDARPDGTYFLSPVLALQHERVGVTLKYIGASYDVDNAFSFSSPLADPSTGLPLPDLVSNTGIHVELDRHDVDVSVSYRLLPGDGGGPFGLTVFTGLRYELELAEIVSETRFKNVPPFLEAFIPEVSTVLSRADFSRMSLPVGVGLSYAIPDLGVSPFLVATLFPLSRVDFSAFVDDGGLADQTLDDTGVGRTSSRQGETGFGGWAVEAGASWSLHRTWGLPVSLLASYRHQQLDTSNLDNELQQVIVGVFYHFLDVF